MLRFFNRGQSVSGRPRDGDHEQAGVAVVREPRLRPRQAAVPILSQRGRRASTETLDSMTRENLN